MRVRVIYHGRVQGVGFRATARSIAQAFPITGFVLNEPDETVLLEAQGAPTDIDAFLGRLTEVMRHKIRRADQSTIPQVLGGSGFEIRR